MEFTATGGGTDYLNEYRTISNKLKKRFLRRPNVSEAIDQFSKLAKKLSTNDEPEYAATCHLAVAKCEQSIGNVKGEVEALVAAARSFFEAEHSIRRIRCVSFQENLIEAISNFSAAIRILEESGNAVRASCLCLELGDKLLSLEKPSEAVRFFEKAADLRSEFIGLDYVQAKEKVASCHLEMNDLHSALVVLTEVANVTQQLAGKNEATTSVYVDILGRCEVLRVLLVLLIEPTPQTMNSSVTDVIEKYAWESIDDLDDGQPPERRRRSRDGREGSSSFLPEKVFQLLQSVVMAVQVRDYLALSELEGFLIPHIANEPHQRELLRRLVRQMLEKSG